MNTGASSSLVRSSYIGARRHRSFIEKKQFVFPSSSNSHLSTRSNSIKVPTDEKPSIKSRNKSNENNPLITSNSPLDLERSSSFVREKFRLTSTPVDQMFLSRTSFPFENEENLRHSSFDQRITDENDKYIIQLRTDDFDHEDFHLSIDESHRQLIIDAKHREEDHLGGYVHRELHKIFPIPEHIDPHHYTFHYDSLRRELIVEMNANRLLTTKTSQLKMSLDLTDYQPENIKVTIKDQELIVKAERSTENEREKCRMSFYQSTNLPIETDIEHLQSNYLDGKLFIEAPFIDRIGETTKQTSSKDKRFQQHTMTMKEAIRRL